MRSNLVILCVFLSLQYQTIEAEQKSSVDKNVAMVSLANIVASEFDYYDDISSSAQNVVKGRNEIGGQCGDYALAFVNRWNQDFPNEAKLVIQQQGLKNFPDGIYEVIGKDSQELPFLNNRKTSMLYKWNNVLGVGHPQIGGYKIRLVQKVHIKSHFGLPNWENNGPHVWVVINDTSIDPTYVDLGVTPVIGRDLY